MHLTWHWMYSVYRESPAHFSSASRCGPLSRDGSGLPWCSPFNIWQRRVIASECARGWWPNSTQLGSNSPVTLMRTNHNQVFTRWMENYHVQTSYSNINNYCSKVTCRSEEAAGASLVPAPPVFCPRCFLLSLTWCFFFFFSQIKCETKVAAWTKVRYLYTSGNTDTLDASCKLAS